MDIEAYKAVDQDITKAFLAAEKAIGNPQVLPWSLVLLTRLGTQYFWKKLQSLKCTRKKIPQKLQEVAELLGQPVDSDFNLSLAQLKKRWR